MDLAVTELTGEIVEIISFKLVYIFGMLCLNVMRLGIAGGYIKGVQILSLALVGFGKFMLHAQKCLKTDK